MEVLKFKNHTIEFVPLKVWSDFQQSIIDNGFKLRVEGPLVNINQQTYITNPSWIYRLIEEKEREAI